MTPAHGSAEPVLQAIGAGRVYGRANAAVPALLDADLAFHRGEVCALRGRSGSGKTTLLNLLGLLDRPTSGRIVFLGKDTSGYSDRRLALTRRGALGYVLQDAGLIENMTAVDNVCLPGFYAGLSARRAREIALRALGDVGLADKAERRVGALSGGERMRVGLARALSLEPQLIIADEPTASLDAETAHAVIDRLARAAAGGACVIAASHDPIVLERATRTVALAHGRVVTPEPVA
ncbi:MAG: ATP-binding cassette domain-containing protein [Alphaproteobacteria bacterium]|nr:ATP-binding cassette domain-containing protein [Alphaproteobacteria bacterium]